MENHGINMKGRYFMQQESSLTAAAANERRIVYNTGTTLNGVPDVYGQNKMVFHNNAGWVRPLLANSTTNVDGPRADNVMDLGSSSYRFKRIYAVNFYGACRYS